MIVFKHANDAACNLVGTKDVLWRRMSQPYGISVGETSTAPQSPIVNMVDTPTLEYLTT